MTVQLVLVLQARKVRKAMLVNRNNRTFLSLLFFTMMATGLGSCSSGCVKCTGITADLLVCKGDYAETADYNAYIQEYEEQGGVCEE